MKKMMFLLALVAVCSFVHAAPPVSEKVLKTFENVFPAAANTRWYESENYVEAYFDNAEVKCRVRFDLSGHILSTIRYYGEKMVSPFLRAKLAQKFPGKSIFGVTEVNSENELSYNFVLEDSKSWTHVKCDGMGQMEVTQKLQKGE